MNSRLRIPRVRPTLLALLAAVLAVDASVVHAASDVFPARVQASDGTPDASFGEDIDLDGDTLAVADRFAAYVFVGAGTAWSEQAKLVPTGGLADGEYEISVAVSGDTVVLGSPSDDDVATNAGAVLVFVRTGTTWSQQAKLFSSDGAATHQLGTSIELDGDTLVTGAPGVTGSTGAGYVFVRSGTTWSQQAKLVATGTFPFSNVGTAVALEGDTAVLGAPLVDAPAPDSGAAFVFVRSGTTWSQEATLADSALSTSTQLGSSLALDGDTLIAGTAGLLGLGVALVFERSGTTWTKQDELRPPTFATIRGSVALSEDLAVVNSRYHPLSGLRSGAAFLFRRSGTSWNLVRRMAVPTLAPDEELGASVALSGGILAIGAPAPISQPGSVYVGPAPSKAIDPLTPEELELNASDGEFGEKLGTSIAVSGDTLVAGAPLDFADDRGSAYVFRRSGPSWIQEAHLLSSSPVGLAALGSSVALDGDTALVGAPGETNLNGMGAGAAYVFVRSGSTWSQQAQFLGPLATAQPLDALGLAVALEGDVAATTSDRGGLGNGSIVVYARTGTTWSVQQEIVPSSALEGWGTTLALSGDRLAVGDPDAASATTGGGGRVFVYERTGTTWGSETILQAGETGPGDRFGASVALEGDRLVVGAPSRLQPRLDEGAAYVFERTGTAWTESTRLRPSGPPWGDRPGGGFGTSVALSGPTIVVAGHHHVGDGLIYTFTFDGLEWTQVGRLLPSGDAFGQIAGIDLDLDGTLLGAGLPNNDVPAVNAGGVALFDALGSPFASFCAATPNSTGNPAHITATGSNSVSANDLGFVVTDLPANQSGLVIYSPDQASLPLGNGILCLGSSTQGFVNRLPPTTSDGTGTLTHALDVTQPPAPESTILPGSTWNFSCWFRDLPAGGALFDFSDGVEVRFAP